MFTLNGIRQEKNDEIRVKNIIDMAMGFTAMTRVFKDSSSDIIKDELWTTALELRTVTSKHAFISSTILSASGSWKTFKHQVALRMVLLSSALFRRHMDMEQKSSTWSSKYWWITAVSQVRKLLLN